MIEKSTYVTIVITWIEESSGRSIFLELKKVISGKLFEKIRKESEEEGKNFHLKKESEEEGENFHLKL
ncbi:hypothetical protein WN51_00240 [Melipona quadrifasciata]|uniref:Uncharacterized protein n=1 Tax=Melipona quadrifasciata TaxID=166423 RepID=A0A0M8ZZX6_9HYME|nr:hypothetical protein WN51_00240 [Melipona quadrifasciata]